MTFRPTSKSELQNAVTSWHNSRNNGIANYFSSYNNAAYITAHAVPSSPHGQNIPPYTPAWVYTYDTTTSMTSMTSQNCDATRQQTPASQWYNNTTAKWESKQVVVSTNSYIRFKYDISSEGADKLQVVIRKHNTNTGQFDAVTWPYISGGNPNIGYYDSGNIFTTYGAGTYTVEILFKKDYSVSQNRDNAIISEFRWSEYPPINTWDTSLITDMSSLFWSMSDFNDDISNWNVSQVTNMAQMFYGATAFNQNISSWNVSQVTDMQFMFYMAEKFNQNIGGWNTSNVTNMYRLFFQAYDFNQNIGSWNTSKVTNMSNLFYQARAFNQDIGAWDVSEVTDMQYMFYDTQAFNNNGSASIGDWNTSKVRNMVGMFMKGNTAAHWTVFTQDIRSWDTSLVALYSNFNSITTNNFRDMFTNNTTFQANFNVGSTPSPFFFSLFRPSSNQELKDAVDDWCNNIRNGYKNIINWDTSLITNMDELFKNKTTFNDNIANWDTSNVVSMSQMFYGATAFNQNIGGWDTSSLGNMYQMFYGASAFNQEIRSWDVSNNYNMYQIFVNATAFIAAYTNEYKFFGGHPDPSFWSFAPQTKAELVAAVNEWVKPSSDTSKNPDAYVGRPINTWNTSFITDMSYLFNNKTTFNDDIGNWNTSNVTNMQNMFYGASVFNQNIGSWNISNVTNMTAMFSSSVAFNNNGSATIGNWNTRYITTMNAMFQGASVFNQDIGSWNTSNVTDMNAMFQSTNVFNQDIGSWDTSSVTAMYAMFNVSLAFNANIGNWDVSNVTDMRFMFNNATAFNQDIRFWNFGSNVNTNSMFSSPTAHSTAYSGSIGYGTTPSSTFFNQFTDNGVTYYFTEDSSNAVTITSAVKSDGTALSNWNLTIPSSFTVAGVVHTIRHIGTVAFGTAGSDILTNLSFVTIPSTVLTIGNFAFRNISSLTTVTFAGTSECTSIGVRAFNATGLITFTLPASVTSLSDYCFARASSASLLSKFTFEGNSQCTSIGWGTFYGTIIESITIPDSITQIAGAGTGYNQQAAFDQCSNLKLVYITNAKAIDLSVVGSPSVRTSFYGSTFSPVVLFPPPTPFTANGITYSYEYILDSNGVTNNAKITGIVSGSPTGDFVVPGGSSYLSAPRWNGSAFISTPITITELGGQICKNNTNITSVTIPTSITVIHRENFYGCTGLTSVIFDQGSAVSQCQVLGDNTFNGCSALTSINLPYSINAISTTVFQNTGIQTVSMSAATATNLGISGVAVTVPATNVSFRGATSVNLALSLIIGTGLGSTFTKQTWFDAGSSLDVEIRDYETIDNVAFSIPQGGNDTINSSTVTNVVLGSGVTTLTSTPFWFTSDLISITLGPDIANIAGGFVGYSLNLTTLILDASNTVFHLDNGILYKKDGSNNTHTMIQYPVGRPAEVLNIPSSTVVISDRFTSSSNISSIVFGNNSSVETIGITSFSNAGNLTSIDIPDSVTSIGSAAFRGSGTNLTDISLPEGATIATQAFKNLGNGTNDVTVKVRGLYTSSALTAWETTNQSQFTVTGTGTLSFILVPFVFTYTIITGTDVSITGSNYGSNLPGVLTIPTTIVDGTTYTVTKISANAFENTSITSVIIHKDITEIGSDAFLGCSNLTTVILPTDNGFSPQIASPSNAQVSFYGATVTLLSSMLHPTNITFPSGDTNNNQVTVNGLNTISAAKLLYSTNGGSSFTEVTLNGLDSYTFTIPDGTYNTNGNMKIIAVDAIDNESITVSNTTNFTIDTAVPIISHQSSVVATINDGGSNLGSVSTDQTVTWSISAGTGVSISNSGVLTLSVPADHQTRQSYIFTVKAVDAAGNESTVTKTVTVIDTTPPNPPGVVFPTGTGGLTNDGTTTVALSATSVAWEYTVDNGVTWIRIPAIGS